MAVNFDNVPPERPVFVGKRVNAHDVINAPVYLKTVFINNGTQVIQFVVTCLHGRLPDLAFLLLAVTHQAIHAVVFLVQPRGEGISDGKR